MLSLPNLMWNGEDLYVPSGFGTGRRRGSARVHMRGEAGETRRRRRKGGRRVGDSRTTTPHNSSSACILRRLTCPSTHAPKPTWRTTTTSIPPERFAALNVDTYSFACIERGRQATPGQSGHACCRGLGLGVGWCKQAARRGAGIPASTSLVQRRPQEVHGRCRCWRSRTRGEGEGGKGVCTLPRFLLHRVHAGPCPGPWHPNAAQ